MMHILKDMFFILKNLDDKGAFLVQIQLGMGDIYFDDSFGGLPKVSVRGKPCTLSLFIFKTLGTSSTLKQYILQHTYKTYV